MGKRIVSLVLSAVLLCSMVACSTSETMQEPVGTMYEESGNIPGDEYGRGVWYGFLPDSLKGADPDKTVVTWKQYCAMLGSMLALDEKSRLDEWEAMTADAPDTQMKRDGAAIALLFAGQVSGRYYCNADPYSLHNGFDWGSQFYRNYPVFDWDQEVEPFYDNMEVYGRSDAANSAYWYLLGRISVLTGKPLLDVEDGNPHLGNALKLRDAMVSVVRLYESDEAAALKTAEKLLEYAQETPEGQEIVSAAQQRKTDILNSETQIVKSDEYIQGQTYTGNAYYVSNTGNDSANGRTPETAWATLERVGKAKFSFGDVVFFERGGLWRKAEWPESLRHTVGLTISAYGEGEKPRFYGSPESGVGAEKWNLYYEGGSGEKIWTFYADMPDCGGMVLNGSQIVKRDVAFWDGNAFVCLNDFSVPYRIEEQLENMELFCELPYEQEPRGRELTEAERLGLYCYLDENGENLMGTLYVRCDQGNPGELFEEVEFIAAYSAIDGLGDGVTLDNLCFRYSTKTISGGYFDGVSNDYLCFQNCEAGFLGGGLNWFSWLQNGAGFGHVAMDGGGINVNGSYTTIRNCYTHHCFQEGIAMESIDGDPDPCIGNAIKDNLVEYCIFGIGIGNWETEENTAHEIQDLIVENNYVLYAGFEDFYNVPVPVKPGEDFQWPSRTGFVALDCAVITMHQVGENSVIKDNTFAFGATVLVGADDMYRTALPKLEHNMYAQLPGIAMLNGLENPWGPRITETNAEAAVREILKDETGTIAAFE